MNEKYRIDPMVDIDYIKDYQEEKLLASFDQALMIISFRVGMVLWHEFETFQLN